MQECFTVIKVKDKEIRIREQKIQEEDDVDDGVDSMFFDSDWSLAASTANKVWESALAMKDYLIENEALIVGKDVIELGSGTGCVGLCASALGAKKVMLTDIGSVLTHCTMRNLESNSLKGECEVLDWRSFSESNGECFVGGFDVILASDCVWLKELVLPFFRTLSILMKRKSGCIALLGQMERAKEDSQVFATWKELKLCLEENGFKVLLKNGDPKEREAPFIVSLESK